MRSNRFSVGFAHVSVLHDVHIEIRTRRKDGDLYQRTAQSFSVWKRTCLFGSPGFFIFGTQVNSSCKKDSNGFSSLQREKDTESCDCHSTLDSFDEREIRFFVFEAAGSAHTIGLET